LGKGQTARIALSYPADAQTAFCLSLFVELSRDDATTDVVEFIALGNRATPATVIPEVLDFGVVVARGAPRTRTIRVDDTPAERLAINDARTSGLPCDIRIRGPVGSGEMRASFVDVTLDVPQLEKPERLAGEVRIGTNNGARPSITVPMRVRVLPEIVCRPGTLSLGIVEAGRCISDWVDVLSARDEMAPEYAVVESPHHWDIAVTRVGNHMRVAVKAVMTDPGVWRGRILLRDAKGGEVLIPCAALVVVR
jgi:hypothetical protein